MQKKDNNAKTGLKKTIFTKAAIVATFALIIIGMTITVPYTQTAAFAAKIEGDEGPNFLGGTPGDDKIDSKGGSDLNSGDTDPFANSVDGDVSGDDKINSGEGDDTNTGDAYVSIVNGDVSGNDKIKSGKGDDTNFGDASFSIVDGDVSGDDKINAGQGDDTLTGNGGADKFQCGSGEDTVTDFNPDEGDKASGNCEGIEKGNGNANGKSK